MHWPHCCVRARLPRQNTIFLATRHYWGSYTGLGLHACCRNWRGEDYADGYGTRPPGQQEQIHYNTVASNRAATRSGTCIMFYMRWNLPIHDNFDAYSHQPPVEPPPLLEPPPSRCLHSHLKNMNKISKLNVVYLLMFGLLSWWLGQYRLSCEQNTPENEFWGRFTGSAGKFRCRPPKYGLIRQVIHTAMDAVRGPKKMFYVLSVINFVLSSENIHEIRWVLYL